MYERRTSLTRTARLGALLVLAACTRAEPNPPPEAGGADAHDVTVAREVKGYLGRQIQAWRAGAEALHAAAPTPSDRGWDEQADADAIARMRAAWLEARHAYELIEGAIAPVFPESDAATDARYEDYLSHLGGGGDRDPFDDQGVIGMHGIERILYSNQVPDSVRHFEGGLPGYAAPRFPGTADEAARFKHRLAQRLVSDIRELEAQFAPLELDLAFAFEGLVDLVNEQLEKTDKAASGEEESRYAQTTLRDLRSNQQGVREVYALFRPWLESRPGGADQHRRVQAAFQRMSRAMEAHFGDGMPAPPSAWSSIRPKDEHRETPFGQLFFLIKDECDEANSGSLQHELRRTAELLGLPSRS